MANYLPVVLGLVFWLICLMIALGKKAWTIGVFLVVTGLAFGGLGFAIAAIGPASWALLALPLAATAQTGASAPDPAELVGPPMGQPLAGAALEARTEALGKLIRCPVCQGSSIADSPSEMAQNMKRQTRELLARGFEDEHILHYFELSYGEFIRLEPRAEGLELDAAGSRFRRR